MAGGSGFLLSCGDVEPNPGPFKGRNPGHGDLVDEEMAPASQCSDLGLPLLHLSDTPALGSPTPPAWAVALSKGITVQLRAAGLAVNPAALRYGIEQCWPNAAPALPDVADWLPSFPGLARPVEATPLCPAPGAAPSAAQVCPGRASKAV